MKPGFCACAIAFQLASTYVVEETGDGCKIFSETSLEFSGLHGVIRQKLIFITSEPQIYLHLLNVGTFSEFCKLPYFSMDNAHLMYNAHPKLMIYTSTSVLLLHLIYLSYLSNVYSACSFFTNLDPFRIDNARVIYRKIRYLIFGGYNEN